MYPTGNRKPAFGRRDPGIGAARIENDIKVLRRCTDADLTVVLQDTKTHEHTHRAFMMPTDMRRVLGRCCSLSGGRGRDGHRWRIARIYVAAGVESQQYVAWT